MAHEKGRGTHEMGSTARLQRPRFTFLRGLSLSPTAKAVRSLKNAHNMQGLFERAIISSDLAYPGAPDGGLVYECAEGGEWVGYDFQRQRERNGGDKKRRPIMHGKLFAALLDEVNGHDPEERTPDSLLDLSTVDHASQFVVANEKRLVTNGMLMPMTYREAYAQVGAYEQYAEDLDRRSLSDELVHTVTPKGHTLVFVLGANIMSGLPPLHARDIDRHLDDGMRLA